MKRRGFTLIDVGAVVVIVGILTVILYPALRPHPLLWSQTSIQPLRFKNAELQEIVGKLHHELYQKRKMNFLKDTRWATETLRHRRITFETTQPLTPRQVLVLVGKEAGVAFQGGGSCGTCGFPMGSLAVVEARAHNLVHPQV